MGAGADPNGELITNLGSEPDTIDPHKASFVGEIAVITKTTLKIKKQGLAGTNPFTTHTFVKVDIRNGGFSGNDALQIKDFESAASRSNIGI